MGGVLAGIAFVIIITRQMEPAEFGTWAVIGSMVSYSVTASPIINYWTRRQVARRMPVGRTSVASSSLLACGSIPVYVISIYLFSNVNSAFLDSMLLGALLVPTLFIQTTLTAINSGHKPHGISVGRAAFQFFKVPAGLALVFFLDLGLDGAILAVFVAHFANILVQLRYARPRLSGALDFARLKKWIRQSWIPLYDRLSVLLSTLDIIIYPIITGSVVGVAFFAASMVLSNLVYRVHAVSMALSPKLLATNNRDHIADNFSWLMYLAIPIVVLAVFFSRHIMFLLNPEYAAAWMVGVLLATAMFMRVIMIFSRSVLVGTDDVDVDGMPSASALLKSRLFLIGTVNNAYYAVYLVTLVVFLTAFLDLPEIELVTVWASVTLGVSVPFLAYHIMLVKRHAPFRVPYSNILKYVAGAAGMTGMFLLTNEHIVAFEISIYSYLPALLLEMAICGTTYLGITYALDCRVRRLLRLILLEIASRFER